jgi:hypothetical protein
MRSTPASTLATSEQTCKEDAAGVVDDCRSRCELQVHGNQTTCFGRHSQGQGLDKMGIQMCYPVIRRAVEEVEKGHCSM